MLNVTPEYYAPMKRIRSKGDDYWEEYRWYSSLEYCIRYLVQKRIAEKDVTVQLNEFVKIFKKAYDDIQSKLAANGVF